MPRIRDLTPVRGMPRIWDLTPVRGAVRGARGGR